MKKILCSVFVVAGLSFPVYSVAGGEVKEVCKDKKDQKGNVIKGKDRKPVKECKKIKVHKKLEGREIPTKSK